MKINVETLRDALGEMEEFLKICNTEEASTTSENDVVLRALRTAVVKAFEFTYELSIRFIRRQLSQASFNVANVNAMDFRDMIRVAADAGLIAEPRRWFEYRKKRNIASHTYDKYKAEEVLSIVDDFLEDARFLLAELTRRNAL